MSNSGTEPLDPPTVPFATINEAVMKTLRAPLPKLHADRLDPVSAPGRRRLRQIAGGLRLAESLFQVLATGHRLALTGSPSACSAGKGTRREIGLGLLTRNLFGHTDNGNLAIQGKPRKEKRNRRVGGDVAPLAAFIVREEEEGVVADVFQQDHPGRRLLGHCGSTQYHGVGSRQSSGYRIFEPLLELTKGAGVEVAPAEGAFLDLPGPVDDAIEDVTHVTWL